MLKFVIAAALTIVALSLVTPRPSEAPVALTVVGDAPEIVWGADPAEPTAALAANFALPEDAIEVAPGVLIVADTQGGYIRQVADDLVTIAAGDGNLPVLTLVSAGGGYYSFSSRGHGVSFHKDGQTEFIGLDYRRVDGSTAKLDFVKFAQVYRGELLALNGAGGLNDLVKITPEGLTAVATAPGLSGLSVAGYDFCGDALIVSNVLPDGTVSFVEYKDGKSRELFNERRPYSNAIKCVGPDEFYYGARWELKRYASGKTEVVAGGFTHIASIRMTYDNRALLVTDSDSEGVFRVSFDGAVETLTTTKGQVFSDPFIKMHVVGKDIIALTPDGSLLRLSTADRSVRVLLGNDGSGELDPLIKGHEFTSLRSFAYENATGTIYLASNHGIFLLDPASGIFELFAGSENEYGRTEGQRLRARFAVIRDLVINGDHLLVADAWNDKVRQIDLSSGLVSTFLGTGKNETQAGNPRCTSRFAYNLNRPFSLAIRDGLVYVANSHSHSIVAASERKACTFAGIPTPSDDQYGGSFVDGPLGIGTLNGPMSITATEHGLLVADMWNNAIRFITDRGELSTLYSDETAARMINSIVLVDGQVYFSPSDSTIKRLELSPTEPVH